ncbi:RNA-binding cell elongation regulator Jag/EloR [Paenibacillus alkalitolerans]|uniref:RNA-binding cell elongation regulator Jag/EloR n=1 Tax=Paenibacillus alkalitolerans TaxID=2799335 RepID=UPI0018F4BF95|nr:RNA-binding cell elongation regulator Jag/EloR [Paenibacillus alkalitolerans]
MTKRVFTGKSVEEAVRRGLDQLGVTQDRVKITVLEQPKKALLGLIGGKDAEVELEIIEIPIVDAADPVEQTIDYLADLLRAMGVDAQISHRTDDEGHAVLEVSGKELGIIIGRRGQTLDALQLLLNAHANRYSEDHIRIILDAEQFRERRKKTLEDLSLRLANQVVRTRKEVVLEPMTAQERRIIHFQLQNHPKVQTYSKGEEPNRRIVITLKQ